MLSGRFWTVIIKVRRSWNNIKVLNKGSNPKII